MGIGMAGLEACGATAALCGGAIFTSLATPPVAVALVICAGGSVMCMKYYEIQIDKAKENLKEIERKQKERNEEIAEIKAAFEKADAERAAAEKEAADKAAAEKEVADKAAAEKAAAPMASGGGGGEGASAPTPSRTGGFSGSGSTSCETTWNAVSSTINGKTVTTMSPTTKCRSLN